MLIEGRKRAEADRMADSLDWVVGDAMALPFEDNSFRRLYHFLWHPECDPASGGAERSLPRTETGWAPDGAGIQPVAQRYACKRPYDLYSAST